MRKINTIDPSTLESTTNKTPLFWSYLAVQHSNHVAVHRAAYDAAGTLLTVAPTPETLTDVSQQHLTDFLSQVMVGIVNRPTITQNDFLRLSAEYPTICAQEQAAMLAEEKTA